MVLLSDSYVAVYGIKWIAVIILGSQRQRVGQTHELTKTEGETQGQMWQNNGEQVGRVRP